MTVPPTGPRTRDGAIRLVEAKSSEIVDFPGSGIPRDLDVPIPAGRRPFSPTMSRMVKAGKALQDSRGLSRTDRDGGGSR